MENSTQYKFFLLGLTNIPYLQAICLLIFSIMYLTTLLGNSLLVLVVRMNPRLQIPMYFFLSNLSIVDILFSSTIVPKLLVNTIVQDKSISLPECAFQMFCTLTLGAAECLILAVMAYDRYAAICKPLHYNTIMSRGFRVCLVAGCWAVGIINSIFHVVLTFQLTFCRSHQINHFSCEVHPFHRLSCQDPWFNELAMYISASIIGGCAFCLTLISYVYIISTIFKIRSSQGRRKAFSTCVSHITVVSLFYGATFMIYLRPRSTYSPESGGTTSIIYTSVTPMLNPIIYSMRNKDIKESIRQICTSLPSIFH
ncbi:hypothetical protein GDO86_016567 [Hymenochirus boettgeri]|uniref:Olfactory receptor n=1 Tax=Hymenochirus boettgeri TaxID=247094 RepID=A0A8T2K2E7_9PIPI|nr:hypothetical protein GDO86_016567 [Hymenochirus boettgeri]